MSYVCLCRCGNPYDPNVSILQVSDLPKNRHQRRFVVKAFQFMEQKTNKYLDEEVSIQGAIVGLKGKSYVVYNRFRLKCDLFMRS